jgi:hypothetical protein
LLPSAWEALVPAGPGERYDFFLSRRGSVAAIAHEVADVLTEKGYNVLTQDYDIPLGASFVEAMHEAVSNSRDLVILFTKDYLQSPYTRKEFTSFEAERAQSQEERHIIVLRCEDVPLRGLLADNVYQDLVSIEDSEERKRRIIAAQSATCRQHHRHRDRLLGCHRASRTSQDALTNLIGSTPS